MTVHGYLVYLRQKAEKLESQRISAVQDEKIFDPAWNID